MVSTTVRYTSASTIKTATDIKSIVNQAIKNYNTTYLIEFNTSFKLSRLEAAVNDSDPSITSNETYIVLRKDANPVLNTEVDIELNYQNEISAGTFSSTLFESNGRRYQYTDYNPSNKTLVFSQLPNGKVQVNNLSKVVYLKDVTNTGYETYNNGGEINYMSGEITLNRINISKFINSSSIQFFATPKNLDINAKNKDLIQIDLENISIDVMAV